MNWLYKEAQSIRPIALCGAILLYAFFGLPTPDNPGLTEALIGVLLILAIGWGDAFQSFKPQISLPPWLFLGRILFIFGLTIPLCIGLLNGHSSESVARDVIPFFFLCLPVLIAPQLQARHAEHFTRHALWAVLILGGVFAVRALAEYMQDTITLFQALNAEGELTYLANAPTILFAGLFILGTACHQWVKQPGLKAGLYWSIGTITALIILMPLIVTLQRAGVFYLLFYSLILAVIGMYKYPYRTLWLIAITALATIPLLPYLSLAFELMQEKTTLVGLNMRLEELAAIWAEISSNLFTLCFGQGWGADFSSPAVAGIRVNFTHSLWSSALLKSGILGAVLTLLYVGAVLRFLLRFIRTLPIYVLALLGPIMIDVFLYATFKSLDFGLILLLAVMAGKVAKDAEIR